MKKLLLLFIFNLVLGASSMAQQAVFSVILNKGENVYGVDENRKSVLLGTSLKQDDVLNVAQGGYVALVYEATGASLELTKSGEYSVADMELSVLKQPTTVLAKYGKFLMKRLNPDEKGNQNLNVTGAVERGDIGIIEVDLPKVNDLYGDQVSITWKQTDDVQDYVITIKDKFDAVIVEKPVVGTSCVLEMNAGELKDEKMIIINVKAKDNEELRSPDFGIKRLDTEKRKSIGDEFASIKMVANSNNVVDKLLIASFFEENKLLADAISYYNQAQALSPDPDGFNILYDNFLDRNGLRN